jgi:hypothetical protein
MLKRDFYIQSAINKLQARTYLEIGVHRGKNFFSISAPLKIAIDPNFIIGYGRYLKNIHTLFKCKFYEKTSDNFFIQDANKILKDRKIDVAFIDGLHTYEQVLKDFDNCRQNLSPNGVIMFHDCNPTSEEAAAFAYSPSEKMEKFPGKSPEWNGDVWKAIMHIRALYKDIEVFVLDCDYGIGVARFGKPQSSLSFTEQQIKELTYQDLEKNRSEFLNLKSPEYWNEFIKTL